MDNEWVLKICLLGSSKLKTEMVRRFSENVFYIDYKPIIGVDITTKRINLGDGQVVKLILMDTAEQEFFGKLRNSYYDGCVAGILFFDKDDDDSFDAVPYYYEEFRRGRKKEKRKKRGRRWTRGVEKREKIEDIPIMLVGIINDLPEKVTSAQARKYALYWGLEFYAIKTTDGPFYEEILKDAVKLYLSKIGESVVY